MPIYEYRCNDCHQLFEEWQKDFQEREVNCPICGGASSRLISNSAFVLKGSGWYVTDYCNRKSEASNGNGKATAKTDESKSEVSAASSTDSNTQTPSDTTGS